MQEAKSSWKKSMRSDGKGSKFNSIVSLTAIFISIASTVFSYKQLNSNEVLLDVTRKSLYTSSFIARIEDYDRALIELCTESTVILTENMLYDGNTLVQYDKTVKDMFFKNGNDFASNFKDYIKSGRLTTDMNHIQELWTNVAVNAKLAASYIPENMRNEYFIRNEFILKNILTPAIGFKTSASMLANNSATEYLSDFQFALLSQYFEVQISSVYNYCQKIPDNLVSKIIRG